MQVANRALAPYASSVVPGHSPLGVLLHRCNLGSQRHGLVLFTLDPCCWIGVTALIVIGFEP